MHMKRVDYKLAGLVGRAVVHDDDLKHRVIDGHQRFDVLHDILLLVKRRDYKGYRKQVIAVDIAVKIVGKGFVVILVYAYHRYEKLRDIYDIEQQRKRHAEIVEYNYKVSYGV